MPCGGFTLTLSYSTFGLMNSREKWTQPVLRTSRYNPNDRLSLDSRPVLMSVVAFPHLGRHSLVAQRKKHSVPGADSTPEMGTAVTCTFRDSHKKIGRKEIILPTKLGHQKMQMQCSGVSVPDKFSYPQTFPHQSMNNLVILDQKRNIHPERVPTNPYSASKSCNYK
jgi:hypothetical protein